MVAIHVGAECPDCCLEEIARAGYSTLMDFLVNCSRMACGVERRLRRWTQRPGMGAQANPTFISACCLGSQVWVKDYRWPVRVKH
jgi:hypothetical protein